MFDWIKNINKEYPEFWKAYISKFVNKSSRFVVISLEKSGPNHQKDVILSFGAIGVEQNTVVISDSFEVILLQYKFLHDNGISNEFIIESQRPKLGEREAIQSFIEYLGNAIIVGYRVQNDVNIINETLERLDCGRLKNEALDIEIMHQKLQDSIDKPASIDEMEKLYKIPSVERHSSAEDAYNLALLFLKLKIKLGL